MSEKVAPVNYKADAEVTLGVGFAWYPRGAKGKLIEESDHYAGCWHVELKDPRNGKDTNIVLPKRFITQTGAQFAASK